MRAKPDRPLARRLCSFRSAGPWIAVSVVFAVVLLGIQRSWKSIRPGTVASASYGVSAHARHEVASPSRRPDGTLNLDTLAQLSNDELGQYDLAEVNLACAGGLPGAEGLDIKKSLATLDRWAQRVRVGANGVRRPEPGYEDRGRGPGIGGVVQRVRRGRQPGAAVLVGRSEGG
jgi:hypothetical protein